MKSSLAQVQFRIIDFYDHFSLRIVESKPTIKFNTFYSFLNDLKYVIGIFNEGNFVLGDFKIVDEKKIEFDILRTSCLTLSTLTCIATKPLASSYIINHSFA